MNLFYLKFESHTVQVESLGTSSGQIFLSVSVSFHDVWNIFWSIGLSRGDNFRFLLYLAVWIESWRNSYQCGICEKIPVISWPVKGEKIVSKFTSLNGSQSMRWFTHSHRHFGGPTLTHSSSLTVPHWPIHSSSLTIVPHWCRVPHCQSHTHQ